MEIQKVAENKLEGFSFYHSAIVTSFHTYPYQREIYEYHYLYSDRRTWLVAIGLCGASPRFYSFKSRDFVAGQAVIESNKFIVLCFHGMRD